MLLYQVSIIGCTFFPPPDFYTSLNDSNPGYTIWTNTYGLKRNCIPACCLLNLWKFTGYGKSKTPESFSEISLANRVLQKDSNPAEMPTLKSLPTYLELSPVSAAWHNGLHWKANILILRFDDLPQSGLQNLNVSMLPYLTLYSFSHSCYSYGCAAWVG